MNGCPDTDRDGVEDSEDLCPQVPGLASLKGCPDSDGDGIVDAEDKCVKTPGLASLDGCPDTDRDGVADPDDKCPDVKGTVENEGCPAIEKADREVLDFAMQNIRFETASANLTMPSLSILDDIASILERYPAYGLEINGYTDNVGNEVSNQQLSEQRAISCLNYLVSKGVQKAKMKAAGFGEKNPIAENTTAAGRRKNRRVEFKLVPR